MSSGVVAAGHPATVEAAAHVLGLGGNAFDAAVAAGFAAAVAEPGLTSLGGGGFLLARTASGDEALFDFFVDTPGLGRRVDDLEPHFTPVTIRFLGADQVFNVGYGSVAVPGCLAGYLHVHRRLGRLDLADVVAPARALAADGIVVIEQQAELFALLEPIVTLTDDGTALFCHEGQVIGTGARFQNLELAAFLDDLPADGFADPVLAATVDRVMVERHGLLTADDLASYEVVEREPLAVTYRGRRVVTNPPPSFGGTLVTEALALFESAGPPPPRGSGEHLVRMADVLDEVGARHTASGPQSTQGTTHVSVCDADGNVAAMTTSNGSGSGVFVPGTGVMLNNMMGEDDLHPDGFHTAPPGQRVGSMMAPSLVVPADSSPVALGSGGSQRIRSALTQVLADLIDHGVGLDDAVGAPRIHWDGLTLQVEPGFDPTAVDAAAAVRPVNVWDRRNLYFGGVHVASASGDGAGDPRRGGCIAIV
jgi:gamma-glutamyltranspeptidase/glutathione hydrolase